MLIRRHEGISFVEARSEVGRSLTHISKGEGSQLVLALLEDDHSEFRSGGVGLDRHDWLTHALTEPVDLFGVVAEKIRCGEGRAVFLY